MQIGQIGRKLKEKVGDFIAKEASSSKFVPERLKKLSKEHLLNVRRAVAFEDSIIRKKYKRDEIIRFLKLIFNQGSSDILNHPIVSSLPQPETSPADEVIPKPPKDIEVVDPLPFE